ncbi:MAG: glutathione S-transferase family protein [Rhodospirillales bacterium]|nr:glutathione S-transferase family protein [Rhodospirillales bacterium]
MTLNLMSHHLCPYVQRAVISLAEKGVPFERTYIDLANKPSWFRTISPLGKTPVLVVDETPIFESAVILEYLEETQPNPLHPADALDRARHRAWIEFGSAILNDIAGFYSAKDEEAFRIEVGALTEKFARIEATLGDGPWFDPAGFSLVDAVFGPVFRYFDTFDQIGDFGILANAPKVTRWRKALAQRASIAGAVTADYPDRLRDFLSRRNSYLSSPRMAERGAKERRASQGAGS